MKNSSMRFMAGRVRPERLCDSYEMLRRSVNIFRATIDLLARSFLENSSYGFSFHSALREY